MSNEAKTKALGMNFGTASGRLRKMILFDLVRRLDLDQCFRCEKTIEIIEDLSIEHKDSWQSASDPKESFFDLDNIAFSHLSCNCGAAFSAKKKYYTAEEKSEGYRARSRKAWATKTLKQRQQIRRNKYLKHGK